MKYKGGKITIGSLRDIIESTYKKDFKEYKGYIRDDKLSTIYTKVYFNPKSKILIVAERPTHSARDVLSDFLVGVDLTGKIYKKIDTRFKNSYNTFFSSLNKYSDRKQSILVGYSLGAIVAENFKRDNPNTFDEIILVSKPTPPSDILHKKGPAKNATEIKASLDPVGILRPLQKAPEREIVVQSKTFNPQKEHSISHWMGELDDNLEVGDPEILSGIGYRPEDFKKMKVAELKLFIKRNRNGIDGFKVTRKKKKELVLMAQKIIEQ